MFLIMMGRIHRDLSEEESMILIDKNECYFFTFNGNDDVLCSCEDSFGGSIEKENL
jgi:hypothetical protein